SPEQTRWIVEDSATRMMLVERESHAETARQGVSGLESPPEVLVIDGPSPVIDALIVEGAAVDPAVLDERRAGVTAESPATLLDTSATTARPKGCLLTHRNFMSETLAVLETPFNAYLREDSVTVMFLPLAHVLARAITFAGFHAGVTIAHSADLSNLVATFGE